MTVLTFFRTSAFVALTTAAVFAQTGTQQKPPLLTSATPETVGMYSERLSRLDGVLQSYIDKGAFPGVAAIVVRDGKIVYHKAFGKADLDANKPLSKDAMYRIASMTKAITSLAVMMLHEEGKIMLDDPISKYIPEFATQPFLPNAKFRFGICCRTCRESIITPSGATTASKPCIQKQELWMLLRPKK